MNTLTMREPECVEDVELVARCRGGDRDAFARIVERYQSLVCALAYSGCGDLARSEDLAQETFIAAWRQLSALKEPARLKPWLCGILRNLLHNSVRRQTRNPLADAVVLEDEVAAGSAWEAPADAAMSKEEETLLWRVLETLPSSYRDPLVLFYRQGDSTAEVADALELSEEAVRQRLSRGRAMLNERMARLVESGLRRSNPSKVFAAGVLVALPLASAQAGVSAGAAATAQGTGALKTVGGIGSFLSTFTSVLPGLAGFIGLWGHIENTRTARERRFVAWSCLLLVGWAILLGVGAGLVSVGGSGFGLRVDRTGIELSNAIRLSLYWLAFCGPLDAYAIWMALRQNRIRAEDAQAAQRPLEASRRGYRLSMYGSMCAMVFGTTSWLFMAAQRAQDWVTLGVLTVVCMAGWLGSAGAVVKQPITRQRVMNVFVALWWGVAFVNLAVLNLRWNAWQVTLAPAAPPDTQPFLNVLVCVFFGSVRAMWYLKWRLLNVSTVRRDSLIAFAVYVVVLFGGVALYRTMRATEIPEVQSTQCMINELLPDGGIRFQSLCDFRNESAVPVKVVHFSNSDFVRVERMRITGGHSMPFEVKHEVEALRYTVSLGEALPPGRSVFLRTEGTMIGRVRKLEEGSFEYAGQHWPGNGAATLRVEAYRLPVGAEVLESEPADLTQRCLPDGRSELRAAKIIAPGGRIAVRIHYRLAK